MFHQKNHATFYTAPSMTRSVVFFISIISSWLSVYTILACYVYVKFHNKKRTQTEATREILSAMWVVHLVLYVSEEFIFIYISQRKHKKLFISCMINHQDKTRNNFLVDHKKILLQVSASQTKNWVIIFNTSRDQLKYFLCWHFKH